MHTHTCMYCLYYRYRTVESEVFIKYRGHEVSTKSLSFLCFPTLMSSTQQNITSLILGQICFAPAPSQYPFPTFSPFLVYPSLLYLMLCVVSAELKQYKFYWKITYVKFLSGNIPIVCASSISCTLWYIIPCAIFSISWTSAHSIFCHFSISSTSWCTIAYAFSVYIELSCT